MSIGKKIKYIRTSRDVKSNDLCAHLGLKTTNSLLCVEDGSKSPTFDRVQKIAEFFGLTLTDLVNLEVPDDFDALHQKAPSALGKKISKARDELGHSIAALAEASGISEKQLKMLERGSSKNTSANGTLALARALGLNVEYLLDDDIPIAARVRDESVFAR